MMPVEWSPTAFGPTGSTNNTNPGKWSNMASEEQGVSHPASDYANFSGLFVTFYDEINNRYLNSSDEDIYEERPDFNLPWWQQLLWSVPFVAMIVVATCGNVVVIWIVLNNKRMRTVTNYFLVNLSVADAMMSTLNVPFNFYYMLQNNDWPFGDLYCKLNQFISVLSISASVLTLMAISIDRYMAIIHPLKPRLGKRATLGVAAAIWAVSSIISSPNMIYYTVHYANATIEGDDRRTCYPHYPDFELQEEARLEYYYSIALLILTYFVPIIAMSFTYARVGQALWSSKAIGECTQRQRAAAHESVKSKRRVVKTMIVVVVIFAVCWLPMHIYFLVTTYYPETTLYRHIQELYLIIYWLAMSNSMYNPIIYCWMNSKFRMGFKQCFRWCCGFGEDGLRRGRALGEDHLDRSARSLSVSRRNGTSLPRFFKAPTKTSKTTTFITKPPGSPHLLHANKIHK
ncbi:tachykinin-like peptides receptor 99D isoform X2 [Choristoneura fumiferana]|uniref:tachykinin-like peptides receptor 99D isoform X2 n=1 Tax=Choristoneura fumiferana TaxID=7141 RepID=UPI003D15775A